MTRAMFRRALEDNGWRVSEAENGRVGLQRLKQLRPDVILLDLNMPEMDGFAFVRELRRRKEWRGLNVVVVTARDLSAEDRRQLSGQVSRILQKGAYSREELLREVKRLLKDRVAVE